MENDIMQYFGQPFLSVINFNLLINITLCNIGVCNVSSDSVRMFLFFSTLKTHL